MFYRGLTWYDMQLDLVRVWMTCILACLRGSRWYTFTACPNHFCMPSCLVTSMTSSTIDLASKEESYNHKWKREKKKPSEWGIEVLSMWKKGTVGLKKKVKLKNRNNKRPKETRECPLSHSEKKSQIQQHGFCCFVIERKERKRRKQPRKEKKKMVIKRRDDISSQEFFTCKIINGWLSHFFLPTREKRKSDLIKKRKAARHRIEKPREKKVEARTNETFRSPKTRWHLHEEPSPEKLPIKNMRVRYRTKRGEHSKIR